MPKGIYPRKTSYQKTNRTPLPEPQPSQRLQQLKLAMSGIDFGFTVFFTTENGETVKYYQGAVKQEQV